MVRGDDFVQRARAVRVTMIVAGWSPERTVAKLLAADPSYMYMIVPGNIPIHEAGIYFRNGTVVSPKA